MIIRHRHFRACGYCNTKARPWFIAQGIRWQDFLDNGIDAQFLLDREPALARAVIAAAEREAQEAVAGDAKRGGCV